MRVGLIVEGTTVPAWIARVISGVTKLDFVERTAVVTRNADRASRSLVRRLYDAIDHRALRIDNDPLALTDVSELLHGIPVAPDVESLRRYTLDVVIDLAPSKTPNDLARYGVWSHAFGDEFVDVITRSPTTEAKLCDANGITLYRSFSRTDPHSVRRNRVASYWKATAFVPRMLSLLHERGPGALRTASHAPSISAAPRFRDLARFFATFATDRVRRVVARDPWVLAFGFDPRTAGEVPTRDLSALRPLLPPPDRLWADPFIVKHNGRWLLFFEEKIHGRPRAHISVAELTTSGFAGEPQPILERDYHLSYPFVFEWNGEWWLIPESSRNQTVELWRATTFPTRWVLERTLLRGVQAADATLFKHGDAWWMCCNIAEPGASKDDELHIFHASSPIGPWLPHRRNPVKSDVRCARPAGRVFLDGSALIRPAQDGSGGYGARLVLHRIERLDPDDFVETEIARLAPAWDKRWIGLHTINACDGLTVIDLRLWRSKLASLGWRS